MCRISLVTVLVVLAFSSSSFSESLRCGNRLIQPGDSTSEVLTRCGEPFSREVVAVTAAGTVSKTADVTRGDFDEEIVEQWIYDQGEGTLLKVLLFRGGSLERIDTGDRSQRRPAGTGLGQVSLGDTGAEVRQAWGEPLLVEDLGSRTVEEREPMPGGAVEKVLATTEKVERWTYDFGPGRFLKLVTFRGGKVVRVEINERP